MKRTRISLVLFIVGWLISAPSSWAQQIEPSDPNRQALEGLLEELNQKIDDADKRMVAHPTFLDELRTLVERYQSQLREVFLVEEFSDGDYTQNPVWVVDSGRFRISSDRKLRSSVPVQRPVSGQSSGSETDAVGGILKGILELAEQQGQQSVSNQESKKATIHTLTRIGPAFEVDVSLISNSSWGSMEVVLLGGEPLTARYRMIYHAAASSERPIEVIRERDSRSYVIDSATVYPALDDGTAHRIQWIRDSQGRMQILVDGEKVVDTMELFYQDDFKGLALVNRGGDYRWGPIKVFEATKVELE